MSADNGVYVLKTGRQYRVKHLQAIDNLYWNEERRQPENTMQPSMILSMFDGCKFTYNRKMALHIASSIRNSLPVCEYGVVVLDAKMPWDEIVAACDNSEKCEHCAGRGFVTVYRGMYLSEDCPECEGTGKVKQNQMEVL